MQRHINELSGHHIVCGLGDTGRYAVAELRKTGTPHVVVDISEENLKKMRELHPAVLQDMLYVVGDATEEEVLEKAGISRASGIIIALPLDKDNLVVTVIVRQRFPQMRIIARSAERKFADRMSRAGASSTVSPSEIGGLRMASELIRPHVVGFLDHMLKEQDRILRFEEIEIKESSAWAGRALHDLNLKGRYNLVILGLKRLNAQNILELVINPADGTVVSRQTVLITMGDLKDVHRARLDAGA